MNIHCHPKNWNWNVTYVSDTGKFCHWVDVSVSWFKRLHEILRVIIILHCLMFHLFITVPLLDKEKEMTMPSLFLCSLLRQSPFSLIKSYYEALSSLIGNTLSVLSQRKEMGSICCEPHLAFERISRIKWYDLFSTCQRPSENLVSYQCEG